MFKIEKAASIVAKNCVNGAIMREVIERYIFEAMEHTGSEAEVEVLEANTVLLETGLDSLGFAVLVAMLEEKLGFDPFQAMEEPTYPITFGEFLEIYENFEVN